MLVTGPRTLRRHDAPPLFGTRPRASTLSASWSSDRAPEIFVRDQSIDGDPCVLLPQGGSARGPATRRVPVVPAAPVAAIQRFRGQRRPAFRRDDHRC